MLICPHCKKPLAHSGGVMKCEDGHSFDIASSGYCNLLSGSKSGDFKGDSREMVAARRKFLDSGTYEPLRNAVCDRALELLPNAAANVVDCGCGEGYYTRAVAEKIIASGRKLQMIGADIAKSATQYAAKRDKNTCYVTASSYHMPVETACADLILSLFAPTPAGEFSRMLKAEGKALQVVPGTEHLLELKEAIYDEPYLNREDKHTLESFRLSDKRKVLYKVRLEDKELIEALFYMTPYVHRTPKEGMERLHALESIELTMSFVLLTFEKEI